MLNHITRGYPPFTIEKEGKIPRSYFEIDDDDKKKQPPQEEEKSDAIEENAKEKHPNEDEKTDVNEEKAVQQPREEGKRNDDADKKTKGRKPPGEEKLYILRNYLVRGVIDKAQFAKYGLVHMVQELYGSSAAGNLLSALSRLFTVFLQVGLL